MNREESEDDISINNGSSPDLPNKNDLPTDEAKQQFPYKLGPFGIKVTQFTLNHFDAIQASQSEPGMFQMNTQFIQKDSRKSLTLLKEFINHCGKFMDDWEYGVYGSISPVYAVTLDNNAKRAASIPIKAKYFAWAYPCVLPKNALSNNSNNNNNNNKTKQKAINIEKWFQDCNITMLTIGGYMYFDKNMKLLQINTLIPIENGGLQFGKPKQWDSNKYTKHLQKQGRFQEISISSFAEKGAKYFCWIFPNEKMLDSTNNTYINMNSAESDEKTDATTICPHGGFAYLFHEPSDSNPELLAKDIYFEILSGKEYENANKMEIQQHSKDRKKRGNSSDETANNTTFHWYKVSWLSKQREMAQLKHKLKQHNANKLSSNNLDRYDEKTNEIIPNSTSNDIKEWNANQLQTWLEENNFGSDLKNAFNKKNVGGQEFASLNEKELSNIVSKCLKRQLIDIVVNKIIEARNDAIKLAMDNKRNSEIKSDENGKEHDMVEQKLRERIKQLEIEIEDMEEFACVVCFERKKNMTLKPCNHLVVCSVCAELLQECPLCRTKVKSSEKTFY